MAVAVASVSQVLALWSPLFRLLVGFQRAESVVFSLCCTNQLLPQLNIVLVDGNQNMSNFLLLCICWLLSSQCHVCWFKKVPFSVHTWASLFYKLYQNWCGLFKCILAVDIHEGTSQELPRVFLGLSKKRCLLVPHSYILAACVGRMEGWKSQSIKAILEKSS